MNNYKGYFRSVYNDILYSVEFYVNDSSKPKELILAGDEPFVVVYNTSDTPFDGIRNSTATIKILSDHYFEDILPNKAKDVKVYLKNEDTGEIVWCGYLTPKIYDMGYTECHEEIELEASDCISMLQHIEYKQYTNNKGIVTFKNIVDRICSETELLDGYYFPQTKYLSEGNTLALNELVISEHNFYSSDLEDIWSMQEVLEEICKYLGLTCMQLGTKLYFVDYTAYNKLDTYASRFFKKVSGFEANYPITSGALYPATHTITEDDIMGSGANISFEPIYNKIYVNCNMYSVDDFFPNPFDDKYLTNRNGEFYQEIEIEPQTPYKASYPWGSYWGSQRYVNEKSSDNEFKFFHRIYEHEYWEGVYYDDTLFPLHEDDYADALSGSSITKDFIGGTIIDLGVARKDYWDEEEWLTIVPNKKDYERYLCISQMGHGFNDDENPTYQPIFRLKSGYSTNCLATENSYLIIDYSLIFAKHKHRNYINPDWVTRGVKGHAGSRGSNRRGLRFRLGIGGKYWNGYNWGDKNSIFLITSEKADSNDLEEADYFNSEKGIVNKVSWTKNINEEGYIIPLKDVDLNGDITFEILLPDAEIGFLKTQNSEWDYSYNNYCWVKDLSIKLVEENQDIEVEESDIVYENIIDDSNVTEMSDIDLKITSYSPNTKPSYSNVGIRGENKHTFLTQLAEAGLSGDYLKPEENIIDRYYTQYSTPTKKITLTIPNNISQIQKIYGADIDNPNDGYVALGTEIDYLYDKQTITLIQKK